MFYFTLSFIWFLFSTVNSFSSYIEIDIYNSITSITSNSNYTFRLLDQTDQIYQNSGLDITFFVRKEEFFKNDQNNINDLLYYTSNQADVTLILVNIPTDETVRGISYINSICSQYSIIVANIYNLPKNFIPYIISHELGHIFGARHDDNQSNIMNSVLEQNKIYWFTENSKNEMKLEAFCIYNKSRKYIYMSGGKFLNSSAQKIKNSEKIRNILFLILCNIYLLLCNLL